MCYGVARYAGSHYLAKLAPHTEHSWHPDCFLIKAKEAWSVIQRLKRPDFGTMASESCFVPMLSCKLL
eukprot:4627130-Amphidinium_carterae.1